MVDPSFYRVKLCLIPPNLEVNHVSSIAFSIKFSEVVDPSFGEQQFHMTTYRCVAPACDNDFDRSVYENYDRWMTDASLGIEVRAGMYLLWTCRASVCRQECAVWPRL